MKTTSTPTDYPKYEVADIFRLYGFNYRSQNGMTKKQHAVMSAIEECRTSDYGYHVDQCDTCANTEIDYNSCRDRHCPKCQGISRRKWIEARLKDILPVPYYHAVFTLPHLLNSVVRYNKRLVYDLLLSSSSDTLLTFGRDPKWLGGEMGFYGILHTWGQMLWIHPHVHYIVPGGALNPEGKWIEAPSKDKFLFPVLALSEVFRGKFIEGLKYAYYQGKIVIPPDLPEIERGDLFEQWIDSLVERDWIVYCKPPFGDAEQVIRYIGRYTHRVAISNRRIVSIKEGKVQFWYKDYASDKISWQKKSLGCMEFIRRFLLHVLPSGFHKIRHYGFLANGRCKQRLKRIRELIGSASLIEDEIPTSDYRKKCTKCLTGKLNPIKVFNRWGQIIVDSFTGIIKNGYAFDTS